MGAVLEKRLSHTAREKKKEKTGPAVQSEAGAVVAETGASASSKLAMLYSKDAGAYQSILDQLMATLGPAGVDQLHADVMARVAKLAAAPAPPEKEAARAQQLAEVSGESVREDVLSRFAGPLEASPDQAVQMAEGAAETANEAPPGLAEVVADIQQTVAAAEGIAPEMTPPDKGKALIAEVALLVAGEEGMSPSDAAAATEELNAEVEPVLQAALDAAAQQAAASGGAPAGGEPAPEAPEKLPTDVGTPTDTEPVDVDAEAMSAMASMGATGDSASSVAYLNPQAMNPTTPAGQSQLAGEIATVAGLESGMTGEGVEVSSPAESSVSPSQVAASFAAGAGEVVQRQEAEGGGEAAAPAGPIELNLAGHQIILQPPPGGGNTIKAPIPNCPVAGLQMPEAEITVDSEGNVQGGRIKVIGNVGAFVTVPNGELSVGAGGAVDTLIKAADLKIGPFAQGTSIDLHIGEGGVTGAATITSDQMLLPLGLIVEGGFIRVALDEAGALSGVGNLSGQIPGVGAFAIQGTLVDGVIGGTIAVMMEGGQQAAPGVTIESANLSGNYVAEGFVLNGSAEVKLGDYAAGTAQASYDFPGRMWSLGGQFPLIRPIQVGAAQVTSGVVAVTVSGGSVGEASAGGNLALPGCQGQIGGSFDVASGTFLEPMATISGPVTTAAAAILNDSGEWGKNALAAAGWKPPEESAASMEETSEAGEAQAEEAASGVQQVQGMFGL